MKRALFLVPVLAAGALSATAHAAERGDTAFVVTYRCTGDRYLVVGYPAYRDAARAPIRLNWQGRTVQLSPSRMVGSGARYLNAMANLEWWSKGNGGTLSQIQSSRPLLTNCVES
jgi:membrane-bound inhibitor of C-type lysozyme